MKISMRLQSVTVGDEVAELMYITGFTIYNRIPYWVRNKVTRATKNQLTLGEQRYMRTDGKGIGASINGAQIRPIGTFNKGEVLSREQFLEIGRNGQVVRKLMARISNIELTDLLFSSLVSDAEHRDILDKLISDLEKQTWQQKS